MADELLDEKECHMTRVGKTFCPTCKKVLLHEFGIHLGNNKPVRHCVGCHTTRYDPAPF